MEETFFQKVKNLDYILLFCLLMLAIISSMMMYSTDGGKILYHTKSHFIKLLTFFSLMLIVSFFNLIGFIIIPIATTISAWAHTILLFF